MVVAATNLVAAPV